MLFAAAPPTNRSNTVQTSSQKKQQREQRASSTQLQADSAALAQQLGRLPGKLDNSMTGSAPSAAGAQQDLQLSAQLKRNDSMSEQYYFVRPASEHATAVQQLRGGFTMQFLEPPNSQMPSGQLTHPVVTTQASARRMSASALAGERSAALCSIPGNSSLLRPGQAPALNSLGVS